MAVILEFGPNGVVVVNSTEFVSVDPAATLLETKTVTWKLVLAPAARLPVARQVSVPIGP